MVLRISFKTSPQRVDWATLDATWALAGQIGGFDGAWMNDHLTDMDEASPGASMEALTLMATLVHHVPGMRVGHAVLANTFRHPVLLAKAATVLDHATGGGGRFVVGIGAGWFDGEHRPFGIPLPPIGERIDRLISAVEVLHALFSPEAAAAPGVTRPDPFYPLAGAVNAPPPLTPGGPPIFLGGQRPRGIALAARRAAGWLLTGTEAGDVAYFSDRRGAILSRAPRRGPGSVGVRDRGAGAHGSGRRVQGAGPGPGAGDGLGRCDGDDHRRPGRAGAPRPGGRASRRRPAAARRSRLRGVTRTMAGEPGEIRRIAATDDAALEAYVGIRNAVMPDNTDSLEQIRWEDTTYPGEVVRFLAAAGDVGEAPAGAGGLPVGAGESAGSGGLPVGAAVTGRIWMHERGFERYWLGIWVTPEARNRGLGSALYAAASEAARAAGKTGFQTELSEAHVEGQRFLAHRGFTEVDRSKMVRLGLLGLEPPEVRSPAGIRLTTLADRPDLLPGIHAVAVETFADIPWVDAPVDPGSFEAFVARDVARAGIPKDAFCVAIDEASGDVVGYASLIYSAGSTTVAYHDMTAVRRAYRGRGIAGALKRATIAWAIGHGLEALDTGNDEDNAPMRAINLALGYQPVPDWLGLRGPLAPPRGAVSCRCSKGGRGAMSGTDSGHPAHRSSRRGWPR